MKVEIINRHRNKKIPLKNVEKMVRVCSRDILPKNSVISVAFFDDKEMTEINQGYTKRKGTTDVLSFTLGESRGDKKWHGEILISLDRAARVAKERKIGLMDEVLRLLVHGIAHLAGHDHHSEKDFKKMRKVELEMLIRCL